MTKLESLQKALRLWQWMSEHPGALKADAYLELGLPIGDLNDCPVCEYDVQAGGKDSDCSHCSLWLIGAGFTLIIAFLLGEAFV